MVCTEVCPSSVYLTFRVFTRVNLFICLFLYYTQDYRALHESMIINYLRRIWNEAAVGWFQEYHSLDGLRKNHENFQSGLSMSRPRFETSTSKILVRSEGNKVGQRWTVKTWFSVVFFRSSKSLLHNPQKVSVWSGRSPDDGRSSSYVTLISTYRGTQRRNSEVHSMLPDYWLVSTLQRHDIRHSGTKFLHCFQGSNLLLVVASTVILGF